MVGGAGNVPTWEYLTVDLEAATDLAALGREGWELVSVVGAEAEARLYCKRPAPTARERWTRDQRAAVYAERGLPPGDGGGPHRRGEIGGDGESATGEAGS